MSNKNPKTDIVVDFSNQDSNAFAIIAKVREALRRGGRADLIEEFTEEATSGDYNHVLVTCCSYVDIQFGSYDYEDEYEDDNVTVCEGSCDGCSDYSSCYGGR